MVDPNIRADYALGSGTNFQKHKHLQKTMYDTKTHRVEDRIVSISQPHIRPIVRGKVTADTEFGAKIAVSLVDGYAFIDKLSWDNFHEGIELKDYVENYRHRFGFDLAVICADRIYRTHDNIRFCKEHGINLSGPKLGGRQSKPIKNSDKWSVFMEEYVTRLKVSLVKENAVTTWIESWQS